LVPPGFKKFQQKRLFSQFRVGKKQISPLLATPGKILKKSAGGPFKIFPTTMNTAFGIGDGNNN